MSPRIAILFVCAVLLIVGNMVGKDGDVSRIAKANGQVDPEALAEAAGNPDGFADDSEVGPLADPDELDESLQQAERLAAMQEQPEIGEFSLAQAEVSEATRLARSDRAIGPLSKVAWLPLQDTSGMKPGEVRTDFDPRLR
ncbi:hypothetical protein LY632_06530 [Erythrobacter sp. SDW2]|uniref:hypothetical protein n=1 Tax=Erythrobacter sp. SDW2 TaxID=2907154 RepID=UPI001F215232|nr:hypothetical protein [Erythrobacter sp. SDW2]UIP08044.1 hypothetical protein LY632_06530 [Erythrobacter sp. SDW2]